MYVSYALGVALAFAVYVLLLHFGLQKNELRSFFIIASSITVLSPYIYINFQRRFWQVFYKI